jgi:hypothetical protein
MTERELSRGAARGLAIIRHAQDPPADGGQHHQGGFDMNANFGGPGWGRTNDQPIMSRPL